MHKSILCNFNDVCSRFFLTFFFTQSSFSINISKYLQNFAWAAKIIPVQNDFKDKSKVYIITSTYFFLSIEII